MSQPDSTVSGHLAPPTSVWGILRRIGPGLIIAGSIVGSGELIATTKTGAEAGFWLLWLVILGCVIKVFVQVELGRFTVSSGATTMVAMDRLPGPRLGHRGNWVIWYWFIMFVASIGQLGGIVGGVGQALSISAPLTEHAREFNQWAKIETKLTVDTAEMRQFLLQRADESQLSAAEVNLTHQLLKTHLDYTTAVENRLWSEIEALAANADSQVSADENDVDTEAELAGRRRALTAWLDFLTRWDERLISAASLSPAGDRLGEITDPELGLQLSALQQLLLQLQDLSVLQQKIATAEQTLAAAEPEERESLESDLAGWQSEKTAALEALVSAEAVGWEERQSLDETYLTLHQPFELAPPVDDKIWAAIISVLTAIILVNGRFGLIQSLSTAMVACFTAITIVNLVMLQQNPSWAVSWQDIVHGMSFRLPPSEGSSASALTTALATFGIIGVGASELVAYPYWCLEKGYARFAGPREDSQAWLDRAQGWMGVMRVDAWGSMLVYTFATVAFYLLGAAVLGKSDLNPESHNLVRYLAVMYSPVFGRTTEILFLFGCFAVLYSTFFVANASHARVFADAMRVMKFIPVSARSYSFWVKLLSGLFPMLCLVIYVFFPQPAELVLLSGIMQAVMLPMLAATALYLRYSQIDPRLAPSPIWDVFLWASSVGMLLAGGWAGISKIWELF